MTTLAADAIRTFEIGDIEEYPMVATDTIYQHAAVGLVAASGHARPLTSVDRFVGFAELRVVNAGAAATKNVRVVSRGKIELTISGVEIQDVAVKTPVYATDDDTFSISPVGGQFVGFVDRFVTTDTAIVKFDAGGYTDPWEKYSVRETLTGTKTFDAQDNGKLFCVTAAGDGDALTLPAVADGAADIVIMAIGGFGTTAVTIDTNASDLLLATDVTTTDGVTLVLTKATQRRGDFAHIHSAEADGYTVRLRGVWAAGS